MKGCELCGGVARMYCESDQASLCWSCDEKVHSANFLVAKHCRNLLCQVCQSPTPWKASGPKLGPTVSICQSCFSLHRKISPGQISDLDDPQESLGASGFDSDDDLEEEDDEDEGEEDDEYEDDDDYDEDDDDSEQGENQVVPWSVTPPSPPVASSSSSEEEEISSRFLGEAAGLNRARKNCAYVDSDVDIGCSSSQTGSGRLSGNDEGNSSESYRPSKKQRRTEDDDDDDHDHDHDHDRDPDGQIESRRSTAIIDSLKRFESQMVSNRENASATILGICRLSRDHHGR